MVEVPLLTGAVIRVIVAKLIIETRRTLPYTTVAAKAGRIVFIILLGTAAVLTLASHAICFGIR